MKLQLSKTARKTWIIVNIISIILIVFFFYFGMYIEKPVVFFVGGGISLAVTVFSFIKTFFQTGLWKMVHSGSSSLDERQMQVVLHAMRYSYSIFTILILVVVYGFAIANQELVNVVLAACLLYLAHILPAAIIGWTEKIL